MRSSPPPPAPPPAMTGWKTTATSRRRPAPAVCPGGHARAAKKSGDSGAAPVPPRGVTYESRWEPADGERAGRPSSSCGALHRRTGVRPPILASSLMLLLAACEEEGVRAYRAPKQRETAPASAPGSQTAAVTWKAPQGWEPPPGAQPMRLATFRPGEGMPEVTLSAFPGDVGGLLANINRWRGQLGLAPIDEAQLARSTQTATIEGVSVTTVDLTGANGHEMLGAVIVPGDGKTWFLKAAGDPGPIAKLRPAFEQFARSFRFQAA